jgi:DNA-binding XRE family transcriptional regulator
MIRNETEYTQAVKRLVAEEARIASQEKELVEMGLTAEQIKRVLDPVRSFHLQLVEEVESYERLKRREIGEIRNLRGLGHALICIRIASGLTQRQLAENLQVSETQVSRDERNEYHGITLERAAKILDAMGVKIKIGVELKETVSA